jgi:hypothetical protein
LVATDCASGALSLKQDKNKKNDGRDQHIQSKETADPIGEQVMKKKVRHNAVCYDPRDELPGGKKETKETEDKVNTPRFHVHVSARTSPCWQLDESS